MLSTKLTSFKLIFLLRYLFMLSLTKTFIHLLIMYINFACVWVYVGVAWKIKYLTNDTEYEKQNT